MLRIMFRIKQKKLQGIYLTTWKELNHKSLTKSKQTKKRGRVNAKIKISLNTSLEITSRFCPQ